jgi:acyl carrier protein
MAGQLDRRQQQRLEALGLRSLEVPEALAALGDLLERGQQGVVAVVDASWPRLARQGSLRQAATLERLVAATADDGGNAVAMPAYVAVLERTPPAERPLLLQAFVREQLAKVMGLADADQIDPGEPLFNMGLDSLMALELMVLLEQNLGIRLNEALVFDHPTIEALVAHFLAVLFPDASAGSGSASLPRVASPQAEAQQDTPNEAWSEQVASVAAMDPAALLEQLRSTP